MFLAELFLDPRSSFLRNPPLICPGFLIRGGFLNLNTPDLSCYKLQGAHLNALCRMTNTEHLMNVSDLQILIKGRLPGYIASFAWFGQI